MSVTSGKTYKVVVNVISKSSGFRLYDNNGVVAYGLNVGENVFYRTVTSSTYQVTPLGLSGATGSIDNVSVKEVGQDWTLESTNASIGSSKLVCDNVIANTNIAIQNSIVPIQKKVKIQYTAIVNSGQFRVLLGSGGTSTPISTSGTHTFIETSGTGGILTLQARYGGFNGSITNISLIEITEDTNLPRIDYTGGVGHWLFEPQSTNLIITSDSGVYGSSPASEILTTAPDGTNTSVRPVPSTGSNRYTGQISGGAYATNTKITYSWYRKRISTPVIDTYVGDLVPQILVNVTQVGSTIQVKSDINGFDRFSATFNITDGSLASNIRLYFGAIVGTGNSSVAYWGHQLEVGSYATSIIPTSGSIKTRLQDAAFGAGSSDLINSTEGVLYVEIAALNPTTSPSSYITISDGTYNNRASIFFSSGATNQIRTFLRVGGASQIDVSNNVSDVTDFNKIAFSYKENNFKVYINGALVSTDTSGSVWSADTVTKLSFSEINTSVGSFQGKAKCVAVFKEALTDAELTCLTTI